MPKVVIIEDDLAISQMYRIKFEAEGYEVETAENGVLGLALIEKFSPDIILLDLMMPEMNGDEMLDKLRGKPWGRTVKVVILTNMGEQEAPPTLLNAIRKVLRGEVYVSEVLGATLLRRMVGGKKKQSDLPMDRLTDRELEIFRLIGGGATVREIAEKLFLSTKTVEAHREHIKQKLNLKSSAELLRYAIKNSPDGQ